MFSKMNCATFFLFYTTATSITLLATLVSLGSSQAAHSQAQGHYNLRESPGPSRQVEIFVNVYDHPKTGFSCVGKAPGQYYADPATKCAVYYVCIPNPTGSMTPQSFACPNGTIFSQATRVCRPHEEVYCNLATRYYDNAKGVIDEKTAIEPMPLPVPVPDVPAVPATSFGPSSHHSSSRRHHQSSSGPQKRQSHPQAAPSPAPKNQNIQSSPPSAPSPNANLFNGNNRFRNTRTNSQPTPSTTTASPPASKPGSGQSGLVDYEYDYGDPNYANETTGNNGGLAHAASSLHAAIIENIAETIAKERKELEDASKTSSSKSAPESKSVNSRRKRETESVTGSSSPVESQLIPASPSWSMLSRRKGQLAAEEKASLLSSLGEFLEREEAEEEEDKLEKDLRTQIAAANIILNAEKTEMLLPPSTFSSPSISVVDVPPSPSTTAFTCEDKVSGVAYADVSSGCSKFYICVTVAKGKQFSYHLACDEGLRFSQALGTCEADLSASECARSEHYYLFSKWHRPTKKHLFADKKKKQIKKQMIKIKEDQEVVEI